MSERNYITVEELNFYINNVFLNEELLRNVPVVGEVSGCSVVNGHCYFTLKDSKSQIKITYFNVKGKFVPVNGDKVLVRGSVDFYSKNGQVNLRAYEVSYFGAGLINRQLAELKDRLEKEGLFSEFHKKELPEFPKRVAVITSIKGAAVQDFITTVRKYNSVTDITVIDVRVQGESCVTDVLQALNNADQYGFDIIVIARGGGSTEDLFYFNDESLVRAIYNTNTPVISAIGHETDYTLCDFVADYRAITPTAAAEKIGYSVQNLKKDFFEKINFISKHINYFLQNTIDEFIDNCEEMQEATEDIISKETLSVLKNIEKIKIYQNLSLEREESTLLQKLSYIESLNPLKLLNKGYFRIISNNRYIYKTKELKENDKVSIIGIDGKINAIIVKE